MNAAWTSVAATATTNGRSIICRPRPRMRRTSGGPGRRYAPSRCSNEGPVLNYPPYETSPLCDSLIDHVRAPRCDARRDPAGPAPLDRAHEWHELVHLLVRPERRPLLVLVERRGIELVPGRVFACPGGPGRGTRRNPAQGDDVAQTGRPTRAVRVLPAPLRREPLRNAPLAHHGKRTRGALRRELEVGRGRTLRGRLPRVPIRESGDR